MSNLRILGLPDLFATPSASAVAESEYGSDFAATQLLTEEPSEVWRSAGYLPTQAHFRMWMGGESRTIPGAYGQAFKADGVGICGHNLWRESGKVRFVFGTPEVGALSAPWQLMVPTGEASPSNLKAGSDYTDIGEGWTPDANWIQPGTPSATMSCIETFDTPSSNPRTGADMQVFWVFARASEECELWEAPILQVELTESGGNPRATLGRKLVTSGTGQWLCFSWDASLLSTASGAGAECFWQTEPTAAGVYIEIGSIVWPCEQAQISGSAYVVDDSGWISLSDGVLDAGLAANYFPLEVDSNGTLVYALPSTLSTGAVVHCFIREDHAPPVANFYDLATISSKPIGYVEVGHMGSGLFWSPAANFSWGTFLRVIGATAKRYTSGGQQFGSRKRPRRGLSIPLEWLSPVEAHWLVDRLILRRGALAPVFVQLLPGDDVEEIPTTMYAAPVTDDAEIEGNFVDNRITRIELEEKL